MSEVVKLFVAAMAISSPARVSRVASALRVSGLSGTLQMASDLAPLRRATCKAARVSMVVPDCEGKIVSSFGLTSGSR